jgi:hypothetical protein
LPQEREGNSVKKHALTTPQVAFVVGTRAALAAGIGLLISRKLPQRARRRLGIGLVVFGALTTIPAAWTLFKS